MFSLLKVAAIALFVLSQWYLSKFLLNTITGVPETEEDEDVPIQFANRVYIKLHIVLALGVVLLAIVKRDSQLLAYFIVAAFAIFMLSSLIAGYLMEVVNESGTLIASLQAQVFRTEKTLEQMLALRSQEESSE